LPAAASIATKINHEECPPFSCFILPQLQGNRIRAHTERGDAVLFGQNAHVYVLEGGAPASLSGVLPRPLLVFVASSALRMSSLLSGCPIPFPHHNPSTREAALRREHAQHLLRRHIPRGFYMLPSGPNAVRAVFYLDITDPDVERASELVGEALHSLEQQPEGSSFSHCPTCIHTRFRESFPVLNHLVQ
jgi:hypothetical protein